MNICWSILFLLLAFLAFPGSYYFNLHFSEWSLNVLFYVFFWGFITVILGYWCIKLFGRSLLEDKIWPWRWTLKYLAGLTIKSILITVIWIIVLLIVDFLSSYETRNQLKSIVLLLASGAYIIVGFAGTVKIMQADSENTYNETREFLKELCMLFRRKRVNNDINNI
jgi:hypothetical protein